MRLRYVEEWVMFVRLPAPNKLKNMMKRENIDIVSNVFFVPVMSLCLYAYLRQATFPFRGRRGLGRRIISQSKEHRSTGDGGSVYNNGGLDDMSFKGQYRTGFKFIPAIAAQCV
jgi:hypothetical protein